MCMNGITKGEVDDVIVGICMGLDIYPSKNGFRNYEQIPKSEWKFIDSLIINRVDLGGIYCSGFEADINKDVYDTSLVQRVFDYYYPLTLKVLNIMFFIYEIKDSLVRTTQNCINIVPYDHGLWRK